MRPQPKDQPPVSIRADQTKEDALVLTIEGRLDAETTRKAWREAGEILKRKPAPRARES